MTLTSDTSLSVCQRATRMTTATRSSVAYLLPNQSIPTTAQVTMLAVTTVVTDLDETRL